MNSMICSLPSHNAEFSSCDTTMFPSSPISLGDSGGPLIKGAEQIGVVSWGISCASDSFPGVYARVSSAYKWIEREVCRENRQYATEAGFRC